MKHARTEEVECVFCIVLLKIIEYCTGSSAKSYQCLYNAVEIALKNIESMDELGIALKDIIDFQTLRDKFS